MIIDHRKEAQALLYFAAVYASGARSQSPDHAPDLGRGGGIRTHDLFVPNEARYQAAPHPATITKST